MFDYAIVDEIVDRIVSAFHPHKIILFGSVASHSADADSDVDLLVIMETDLPYFKRSVPIALEVYDIDVPKDIIILTPEEYDEEMKDNGSMINTITKQV